jgi:hypothetical protein
MSSSVENQHHPSAFLGRVKAPRCCCAQNTRGIEIATTDEAEMSDTVRSVLLKER